MSFQCSLIFASSVEFNISFEATFAYLVGNLRPGNEKKKRMKKPRSPTTVKEKPRPRKVRMARCRSVESRKIGGSRKVLASETMKHKRDLA